MSAARVTTPCFRSAGFALHPVATRGDVLFVCCWCSCRLSGRKSEQGAPGPGRAFSPLLPASEREAFVGRRSRTRSARAANSSTPRHRCRVARFSSTSPRRAPCGRAGFVPAPRARLLDAQAGLHLSREGPSKAARPVLVRRQYGATVPHGKFRHGNAKKR